VKQNEHNTQTGEERERERECWLQSCCLLYRILLSIVKNINVKKNEALHQREKGDFIWDTYDVAASPLEKDSENGSASVRAAV